MVVLLICLDIKSEDVIVDFPNHKNWKGSSLRDGVGKLLRSVT